MFTTLRSQLGYSSIAWPPSAINTFRRTPQTIDVPLQQTKDGGFKIAQYPANYVPIYNNAPQFGPYYGQLNPYQYYPNYPHQPEFLEPEYVFVTPRPKSKKKKTKPTTSLLPKDTMKLVDARPKPEKLRKEVQMDIKIVKAVQQPNNKFIIEEFVYVPGKRISEFSTVEKVPLMTQAIFKPTAIRTAIKSQKLELQREADEDSFNEDEEESTVKVDSVGQSSADQPINGYDSYFPESVYQQKGSEPESTLILEPHSKAIAGNDGTAISAPVSRAILRRGTAVKVLFKPQSVAIAGSGGTAIASADLILDFID